MTKGTFQQDLKKHLTKWLKDFNPSIRSDGVRGWVLAHSASEENFYDKNWRSFIEGKEHRWSHALNSSQVFAVNLFAPAQASKTAASKLWRMVAPSSQDLEERQVEIFFEFSGPGSNSLGREALGEQKQQTQIDVALRAESPQGQVQYCLIEVKLSESKFGTCRGAKHGGSKCKSLLNVLAAPSRECWMAEHEGRKYWPIIRGEPHALQLDRIATEECPWQGSLYQIMRNWAFGQALVAHGHATDFHFAVCVHSANSEVFSLKKQVAGRSDAVEAFDRLISGRRILRIDPQSIVALLDPYAPRGWGKYMRQRYLLGDSPSR